jgi:protoporphyrinogen oxidase
MARVVVIGAGAMGLMAAYRASKDGHDVDLLEAASEPGGMAGHFNFDGISLERFYHFICRTDQPTFEVMKELGIEDTLRWRDTTMGFFDGKLHRWGDPVSLLRFPSLGLIDKLRYGLFAFLCVRRDHWTSLEHQSAKDWIIRYCGRRVYERFWRPLFQLKFYEYAEDISAAWIWTRIRRIGRSRRSIFQEQLGYMEGGSITLVNALVHGIKANHGRVHLGQPVQRVMVDGGRVTGVQAAGRHYPADAVICTAPTPHVSALVPDLPSEWKQRYDAINNIGVICVIFKLSRSVSPHFWINICEVGVEIPGVIEFSNLRSFDGHSIVYVPYYMPTTNEKFSWTDERLVAEAFACLQRINPAVTQDNIRATKVARLRYGQPICEANFLTKLPAVRTPISGLQIADTCFYYPEDRGIAESVRLGAAMAAALSSDVTVNPAPAVIRS